jgi:hypothetical protein
VLSCAVARLPQVGHLEVLQLIAEHSGDLDASDKRGRFACVCLLCLLWFVVLCCVVLCLLCFALLVLLVCVFVLLACLLDRLFVCFRTIIGLLARGFVCVCVCSVPLSPWCYLCPFVFRIAPLARWFCLLGSPLVCLFARPPAVLFALWFGSSASAPHRSMAARLCGASAALRHSGRTREAPAATGSPLARAGRR